MSTDTSKKTGTEIERVQYTKEQIEEIRSQSMAFYKEEIPALKLKLEYEVILADIEEAKTKRLTMIVRQGQMMAPPPKDTLAQDIKEAKDLTDKFQEEVKHG